MIMYFVCEGTNISLDISYDHLIELKVDLEQVFHYQFDDICILVFAKANAITLKVIDIS